jgi:hypothetical protein
MDKLLRVIMHISYWPQYAHRDLKEHLTSGINDDKTLCGLVIEYRQWEAVIGANKEIDDANLKKCKKCSKIKEKYNAEVY